MAFDMTSLAERALHKLREQHFNLMARAVLETPPVAGMDDGVVIFSMIGTRVMLPYLIAAKSLHSWLRRGRFVILDDGTLTSADRGVLKDHLGSPEILSIAAVEAGDCPRGGCWERLLTLLSLRRDAYVIQLDSDTVTREAVTEVAEAIDQGLSFTLRGDASSTLQPASAWARDLADLPRGAHVQAQIEAVLHRIGADLPQPARYVRGCAGFAGFARGGQGRAVADAFSREAIALLGQPTWSQWGSEQVMSNVIIANEPNSVMLPYDKYMNYWLERDLGDTALVHFLGTCRYHRGMYRKTAREAISALQAR